MKLKFFVGRRFLLGNILKLFNRRSFWKVWNCFACLKFSSSQTFTRVHKLYFLPKIIPVKKLISVSSKFSTTLRFIFVGEWKFVTTKTSNTLNNFSPRIISPTQTFIRELCFFWIRINFFSNYSDRRIFPPPQTSPAQTISQKPNFLFRSNSTRLILRTNEQKKFPSTKVFSGGTIFRKWKFLSLLNLFLKKGNFPTESFRSSQSFRQN